MKNRSNLTLKLGKLKGERFFFFFLGKLGNETWGEKLWSKEKGGGGIKETCGGGCFWKESQTEKKTGVFNIRIIFRVYENGTITIFSPIFSQKCKGAGCKWKKSMWKVFDLKRREKFSLSLVNKSP